MSRLRWSPTLVADAGVENVNSGVDGLIDTGLLRRVLALRAPRCCNQDKPNASVEMRTFLSDTSSMNGNELLKRLKKIARERRLRLLFVHERGKGSHGTLYLGDRYTIMKDRKKRDRAGATQENAH